MECIICNTPMKFFFSKRFDHYGLDNVDYWKCPSCGFCASKTHFEMPHEQWGELNEAFHADNNRREDNPYNRNQRYFNQALMIQLMSTHGLLAEGEWLDWGCGVGSLAAQLRGHFNLTLKTYDKYVPPGLNALSADELVSRGYGLVVNTAVFEHVRDRGTLDEIESYVAPNGALAVHTLVPEAVPCDPDWMYLLPVHCAFHTNRSMQLLMEQWGYSCSIYNEHAKLWVMFHGDEGEVERRVDSLNRFMGWDYLHYMKGFVDYWK